MKYSFLISAVIGEGCQRHSLAVLVPGKSPKTHCTRGWVDPKAHLCIPGPWKLRYFVGCNGNKNHNFKTFAAT
jgi:hypothetical protein